MENDLWNGISIMSPEEVNNSASGENDTVEDVDTNEQVTVEDPKEDFLTDPGEDGEGNDNGFKVETVDDSESDSGTDSEEERQIELNKYGALIKDLQEEGILTTKEGDDLEEELKDASIETIKKLMGETINEAFKAEKENWKKGFSGAKKRFLEIEDSFDNTDYAIQMAQRLDYLDSLDESTIQEDVNLQRQILAEDLRNRNYSEEDIREEIEDAEAIGKLEAKALKSLPNLKKSAEEVVKISEQRKQEKLENLSKEQEKQYNTLMETIDSTEELIPGLKLNKVIKDKIKNNITTTVYQDKQGREYTSLMYKQHRNPTEFQTLINYYDSIGLFNIGKDNKFRPDISKIKNAAKTKAVSELDKVLQREESQGVGRGNSYSGSSKTESVLELLKRAKGKK